MNLQALDFAQGKKTITGIVIMLSPLITYIFGVDLSEGEITQVVERVLEIVGASLTVYGLVMKFARDYIPRVEKWIKGEGTK